MRGCTKGRDDGDVAQWVSGESWRFVVVCGLMVGRPGPVPVP